MKNIVLFLFFSCLSQLLFAQEICDNGIDDDNDGRIDCVDTECPCNECSGEQANIWYFGNRAGLDFNSGSPVVLTNGQVNTGEGCATMSDANGNLLFYTDGQNIWNRNHVLMTNGTGLTGHPSSTQSGIIVPHPGDKALYYVFTVDFSSGNRGLRYSIVDLSLQAGLGEVTTKNVLLIANTTEKIGVVKHCNNKDYWIVGHEFGNSNYYVYELNSAGFNATPNIQSIGTAHSGGLVNKLGYLKPSADGKRLAAAIFGRATIDLFDFDNSTGILSNPRALVNNNFREAYGIEFSLDSRYLYATNLAAPAKVMQLDLNAGSTAAIVASTTILAQSAARYEFGSLQMAPNGRIYVSRREVNGALPQRTFISSINNPAIGGVGANFVDTAIVVSPGLSNLSLPTFVQGYFLPITSQITSQVADDTLCTTTGLVMYQLTSNVDECVLDTISWTHSGVNTVTNTTDSTLTLNVTMVGQDTIIAQVTTTCLVSFDTLVLTTIVCPEICDNQIDDDGDGLIDYFDEIDCPCNNLACNGATYNICATCSKRPTTISNWAVNQIWRSTPDITDISTSTPVVGDIDGDCVPEVIYSSNDSVYVLDGTTGLVKYRIGASAGINFSPSRSGNIAIADVDNNGRGDIFVTTNISSNAGLQKKLVRLEYNGVGGFNQLFVSTNTIGPYVNYDAANGSRTHFMSINIADVNQDGRSEINIGNQIFDATNGNLLASGITTGGLGSAIAWSGASNLGRIGTGSVLVDILPDNFCADCAGLELVAGNTIYTINIPAGGGTGTMTAQVVNSSINDGFTSVADLDFDGQLEVVTGWGTGASHEFTISAWNPLTGISYDQFTLQSNAAIALGRIAIADLDNAATKDLEIAFHFNPKVYTYKFNPVTYTFSPLADITVSDASRTSLTVFDFDGNGANEVVYRDETTLRVLSGGTLTNVVAPLSCNSNTDIEYPLVVDANGDGQTEILVACGNSLVLFGNGQIGEQWVPSRKIWNQFSYFYTNINDDLSIPIEQQAQQLVGDSIVLNRFLSQYGDNDILLPDADLQILSAANAPPDSSDITIQICNIGNNVLPAQTPITFYNSNPTTSNAAVVGSIVPIGQNVEVGACVTQTHRVLGTSSDIFVVVNCDNSVPPVFDFNTDFPMTTITECDYNNNMDSERILLSQDLLHFSVKKYQIKQGRIAWLLNQPEQYASVTIQRSADAQNFEILASNVAPTQEQYFDIVPRSGHNYYRLQVFYPDGTYFYSPIKELYFEPTQVGLLTIPNPFDESLQLQLQGETNAVMEAVQIVNVLGQVVFYEPLHSTTKQTLSLQMLPAGTYFIQVRIADNWLQRKIVKQ